MNEEAYRKITQCIELHRAEAKAAGQVVARLGRIQRSARSGKKFRQADIIALDQANTACNRAEEAAASSIIELANNFFE